MANNIRLILVVLMVLSISISTSEFIFLPVAQAGGSGSSNSGTDIGLIAWTNIGKTIDLYQAKSLFNTIGYEDDDSIVGTYSFYVDNYNTETVNLFITSGGYIAVYYRKNDPASKIVSWSGDETVFSKFATAMSSVGQSLGYNVDYRNIKYYDYKYPNANRMLIATQSAGESIVGTYNYGNFQFNIPSYATVYEVSYSFYLNDPYFGGANIAIDTNPVDSMTNNGVIYDVYDEYISTDTNHLFGVMSGQYAQSGAAMVIIYRDDNDNNNNKPTIVVSNADNYIDGTLDNPGSVGQAAPTYAPSPEVTPVPTRRTPHPVVTVPMPTAVITSVGEPEVTTYGATPVPTRDMRKPPRASVDLHGERTNIEMGQQALLKGSVVSFNTNSNKMHAQVIIIPPSGVSVVSTDFVKSPAGQYTSDFELDPGKGKDIEVTIVPNEPGDLKVTAKITYYFGDDRSTGEYEEINLPIKVREKGSGGPSITQNTPIGGVPTKDEPGFEIILSIGAILLLVLFLRHNK